MDRPAPARAAALFGALAGAAVAVSVAQQRWRKEFFRCFGFIMSRRGYVRGRQWRPQAGDVVIATPPKTGTTWLSQVCHQIRMLEATEDAAMDFEEITEVVPWVNLATDVGVDLDAKQLGTPRLFKSHMLPSKTNVRALQRGPRAGQQGAAARGDGNSGTRRGVGAGGPKVLAAVRNPIGVLKSLYSFRQIKSANSPGNHFMAGIDDVDTFIRHRLWKNDLFGHSLYDFYAEYWAHRGSPALLVVPYEALLSDFDGQLQRIATFLGRPDLTDAQKARVKRMCSREFMLAHKEHFDDHWIPARQKLHKKTVTYAAADKVRTRPAAARKSEEITAATIDELGREWDGLVDRIFASRQEASNAAADGRSFSYEDFVRGINSASVN